MIRTLAVIFLLIGNSGPASAQDASELVACLDKTALEYPAFIECQEKYFLPCMQAGKDIMDKPPQIQCFSKIERDLQSLARHRIASARLTLPTDATAKQVRAAEIAEMLGNAALKKMTRTGQAECDFLYEISGPNRENTYDTRPECYANSTSAMFWVVVVHKQYFDINLGEIEIKIAAPAANAQQGEALALCLDNAGFQLAGFEDCKARYLLTCTKTDDTVLCYDELAATLQMTARERIAAETLSGAGDLGGGRQTNTDYRKRIAAAVFRRALRIGQADCDFYEETILPAEDGSNSFSKPRCRAERTAAAYWRVIVLRQYYYPKLSTTP